MSQPEPWTAVPWAPSTCVLEAQAKDGLMLDRMVFASWDELLFIQQVWMSVPNVARPSGVVRIHRIVGYSLNTPTSESIWLP